MALGRNDRLNLMATGASVAVAVVLVGIKLWALSVTGSMSVAASLVDSGLDLLVSLGGLIAVRYAQRPPDHDHAFGHSSAEDLAALSQSVFIAVSAIAIAWVAFERLRAPAPPEILNEGVGMALILVSVALTAALVAFQTRVARITGNRVVLADRLHYLADLMPNLGALAALFAAARFDFFALDSVVALAAAAVLLTGTLRIGAGAWHALMDRAAPAPMIAGIERIARDFPGLHGFHDLKTRTAGSRIFVNLHVEIDGTLTLTDAHAIGAALRRAIMDAYPQADVIIHKDPVMPEDGHQKDPDA